MSTLIHITSSPYDGLKAREGLDFAMVLATFEQEVDLAFSGAGVGLLITEQAPTKAHGKALHKMLPSFEFYDIEKLYVQESDVLDNNITALATPVSEQEWQTVLTGYTHIFRF